jgi:DMSO/TMAO reductase YedYZ molybdopterin-dependent catalytic subunit
MNRRDALRQGLGGAVLLGTGLGLSGAAGSAATATAAGAEVEMILRNSRPLDLETPVTALDALDHRLTPNDAFFVRSHLSTPKIKPNWSLDVGGMVNRARELSLADFAKLEQVTVPGVLQCSGNGRGNFVPRVPGVPWERGAVGCAEWSGVRLADLLELAGVRKGAGHVHFLGADPPPSPKTPVYLRSLPIERALERDTIVATRMNGEPLPFLHGGPMRLVVPGYTGNHWMKWLMRITVAQDEAPGVYQQSGYRLAKASLPPGAAPKPSDTVPLTWMNVKSLITFPAEGSQLQAGRNEVRGVAWTGRGHVTKVEFATDRQPQWVAAELKGEPRQGGWRTWRVVWDVPQAGKYTLRVRATDSNGETQPETPAWNKSGYLWNGIDHVHCEVR